MTVILFVYVAAFVAIVVSAAGRCPLWVPVLLLTVGGLLQVLPLR